MTIETLRKLLESDALLLYAQPKWTFGQNTCNTYEVFVEKVRMDDGTLISSKEMVDEIERDPELTLLFSEWFLRKAVISALTVTEKADANVTLSVNLLPLYANQPDFAEQVRKLLDEVGLMPYKLQFELSEAQLLSPVGVQNLNALHDEDHVGLWIGNFGTGNSNINLLREVHFDGIELDRSYAAAIPGDEQTCRVVVAIQHLADTLDLKVCAKGIENIDQFVFYEDLGFLKGQGYMIKEPMPVEEMIGYISEHGKHRRH
ncbi:MAG: EAL domain-containing protein [Clostridia bacterium]|nr:EAL domain-containing protein [Clostridia bacterium]